MKNVNNETYKVIPAYTIYSCFGPDERNNKSFFIADTNVRGTIIWYDSGRGRAYYYYVCDKPFRYGIVNNYTTQNIPNILPNTYTSNAVIIKNGISLYGIYTFFVDPTDPLYWHDLPVVKTDKPSSWDSVFDLTYGDDAVSSSMYQTIPVRWNRGGGYSARNFLRNSGQVSPKVAHKSFPSVTRRR